jgi:hypothetical protein
MSTLTPSGEKLVILLNETFVPPTIFDDTRISFGVPTDAPGDATDYDTVVIGSAIPGMGYFGDAEIHYTRVPLINLGTVTLASLSVFTPATLIAALNAQCEAFLDVTDFVSFTIPTIPNGGSAPLTLTADPSSLGWKGAITLTLLHDKPQLSAVVGAKTLNAMVSPDAAGNAVNGRALLFNVDFTSFRDAIKPMALPIQPGWNYMGFTDYAALADVCARIGIPGFPAPWVASQVADYATSQIADSNQNFDRVVVMGYVPSGPMYPGPLYFHYNLLDNR